MPSRWKTLFSRETLPLLMSWRDPRTPTEAKLALLGLAAYVLSPVDIIPDFFPIVGWFDDAFIIATVLNYVRNSMPQMMLLELQARGRRSFGKYLVIAVTLLAILVGGSVALVIWWRRHR